MQFNINGGTWQSSGIFNGLYAGTYTVNVRDKNSTTCTKTTTVNIIEQPVVLPSSDVSSPIACPNKAAEIVIENSKHNVNYKVYKVPIGGTILASAYGNGSTLNIDVGLQTSDIDLYVETETASACISIARVPVKIIVRNSLADYPDIRMQICTEPDRLVNLAGYLDTTDFKSAGWQVVSKGSPIPLTQKGTISTGSLKSSENHIYSYKISNNCYSEKTRRFYIKTIKETFKVSDTVIICKDFADAVNLNQILGLEANGAWNSDLNSHVLYPYVKKVTTPSVFEGARILNGARAYTELQSSPFIKKGYKNDPNAVILEFSYKTDANSCLKNMEYKFVVIVTSSLL